MAKGDLSRIYDYDVHLACEIGRKVIMILHYALRRYCERVSFNAGNLPFQSALEYHLAGLYTWQTTQDR